MKATRVLTCLFAATLLAGCGTQPGSSTGAAPLVRAQAGAEAAGVKKFGEVPAGVEDAIKEAISMQREFHKLLTLKIVAAKGVTTPGGKVEVIYFFSGSYKFRIASSTFWPKYGTVNFEGQMQDERIELRQWAAGPDKP